MRLCISVLNNLNNLCTAPPAFPSVCKGLNSGLSGPVSIRMQLSGSGFTGEYACIKGDARAFSIGKRRLPTRGVSGRTNSALCDKADLSMNVGSELVV